MKKNSRFLRIIAVVMLSLLVAIPLVSCGKGDTVAADASGTSFGISWDYKQHNQTLTIRKTGEGNPDFADANSVAWNKVASSVKEVYIEDGVEGVGDYWFYGMDKLVNVRLPGSITYIGKSAFAFCTSLGQIGDGKLPTAVTTIRDRAFEASGLTNIDLPASLVNKKNENGEIVEKAIGNYAFIYCNKLSNVVVRSEDVTSFEDGVFSYCTALSEVNMAADVADGYNVSVPVKNGTLYVTPSNFSEGVLKKGYTRWEYKYTTNQDGEKIGTLRIYGSGDMEDIAADEAWKGSKEIKESHSVTVRISSDMWSISAKAFEGMTNIKEVVLEKTANVSRVATIYDGAFKGCTGLTSFDMGNSVTDIRAGAFEGSGLESVDLPDCVKEIGERAFADCKELKVAVIRSSVKDGFAADNAFGGCGKLNQYYVSDDAIFTTLSAKYAPTEGETATVKVEQKPSNWSENFTVYHELVEKDESTDNSGEAAPAPAPEAPKNDGKKGSKIALIIMGVLVVGIIVAIVLFKRYDKKTSGNNTTVVKNKDGQNAKNAKNVKNAKNGKKGKK